MPDNDFSVVTLATLAEAKRELKENGSVWVADDTYSEDDLMDALRIMTKTFEDRTERCFQPRPEARYFDARQVDQGGSVRGYDLLLDHELYELTSVVNGDGSPIVSPNYTLIPKNGPPYTRIRLTPNTTWLHDTNGIYEDAICVTGVYVGGRAYSGQWLRAVDTLNAGVDAEEEDFQLTWADNLDPFGRTPKFSPGMLLRATVDGETEYLGILKDDEELGTAKMRRGERGTTAIPLPDDTPLDVWWVDPRVSYAVAYGAAFLYKQRGRFQTSEFNAETGINTKFSAGLPGIVEEIIAEYSKRKPTLQLVRPI